MWFAATLKDKQRPGELKIVKKTSDGSPVNGFKFFVKGKTSAGKSFEKIFGPTDENGIIVNDIDAGTYEITELMDKDQNLKYRRPESRTVTLEDGDDETIEFENEVIPDAHAARSQSTQKRTLQYEIVPYWRRFFCFAHRCRWRGGVYGWSNGHRRTQERRCCGRWRK